MPVLEKKQSLYSLTERWICDHAGIYVPVDQALRQRHAEPTIKMACPAMFYAKTLRADGSVEVKYNPSHNHETNTTYAVARARLDKDTTDWVDDLVAKGMQWPAIKALLRLDPEEMDDVRLQSYGGSA